MIEEYVDILDEDGKTIGRSCTKSEAHKLGYFHPTVHVWLFNHKGKILIQKRALQKETFPDLWDVSVAGHVSAGESIINSAIREVNEEVGLTVTKNDLIKIGIRKSMHEHSNGIKDYEFHHMFISKKNFVPENLLIQQEELSDLRLISVERFKNKLKNNYSDFVPHGLDYYNLIINEIEKCLIKFKP